MSTDLKLKLLRMNSCFDLFIKTSMSCSDRPHKLLSSCYDPHVCPHMASNSAVPALPTHVCINVTPSGHQESAGAITWWPGQGRGNMCQTTSTMQARS